jgi:Cys-tRNA(Pro)/Cys-tRNA(Cys) deacylase
MAQKTNAARLLDQMGIQYELREYEVDPDDLAAETVAAKIGLPAEQVFKTLVARGDRNGISMAVIPGDQGLDLKALAAAAGERKVHLVPVKELQALTGYIRGGVTALAAKRDFPVYVDETIGLFEVVSVSAGVRGVQILIAPADYLRATKGTIGALGQPKKINHTVSDFLCEPLCPLWLKVKLKRAQSSHAISTGIRLIRSSKPIRGNTCPRPHAPIRSHF